MNSIDNRPRVPAHPYYSGPPTLRRLAVQDGLLPGAASHHGEERVRQQVAEVDGDAVEERTNQDLRVPCTDRLQDTISNRLRAHPALYCLVSHCTANTSKNVALGIAHCSVICSVRNLQRCRAVGQHMRLRYSCRAHIMTL